MFSPLSLGTHQSFPVFLPQTPVLFSGTLLTLRDGTLRTLFSEKEGKSDFLRGAVIYFCGPTPPPLGKPIGSCGPTTSSRMEPFFPNLISAGVHGILGKGEISTTSSKLLAEHNIPYFGVVGGIGAFLAECVESAHILALPELGAEAVWELTVKNFPAIALPYHCE